VSCLGLRSGVAPLRLPRTLAHRSGGSPVPSLSASGAFGRSIEQAFFTVSRALNRHLQYGKSRTPRMRVRSFAYLRGDRPRVGFACGQPRIGVAVRLNNSRR